MQPIAMATNPTTGDFDAGAARRGLLRSVITAMAVTAAALAGMLLLVNNVQWWKGYTAATVASALAAGLSLIPLLKGLNKGMAGLMPAAMAATGVRTAVVIGGCVLAIVAGKYPATPTLILVMPYYAALLLAETTCLAKLGGGKGNK